MEHPSNFVPHEMWPEFDWLANPPDLCAKERVPGNPCGIRWSLWPLTFEEHVGDQEPDISTGGRLARPRLVSWKRVHGAEAPKGWHSGKHPWRIDAYYALSPDYAKRWNNSSRRDLRLWKRDFLNKTHRIERISRDEYAAAYRKSTIAKKIGTDLLAQLERKLKPGGPELWGVRSMESGAIIAGMAVHYSPTYKSSMREGPFILPEARKIFAMTALMDHWFARSLARGTELLIFSHFSHPGGPKGWEGFSAFKRQFGAAEVAYPPVLWRLVWGKPW